MLQVFEEDTFFILTTQTIAFSHTEMKSGTISCFETAVGNIYNVKFSVKTDDIVLVEFLLRCGFRKIFENCWAAPELLATEHSPLYKIFFDYVSDYYDGLINKINNVACYEYLYSLASDIDVKRLLDFGCGTGVISEARFFDEIPLIEGYDESVKMTQIANRRGLRTVNEEEFFRITEKNYDVIISCYVFHYGIKKSMLLRLIELLKLNGVLVANLHKGINMEIYSEWCDCSGWPVKWSVENSAFGDILRLQRL